MGNTKHQTFFRQTKLLLVYVETRLCSRNTAKCGTGHPRIWFSDSILMHLGCPVWLFWDLRLDYTTCSLRPGLNRGLFFSPSFCYLLRLVSVFSPIFFSTCKHDLVWVQGGLRWVACHAPVMDFDRWLSQLSGASHMSLSPGEVWHARFRSEETSIATLISRTHTPSAEIWFEPVL